MRDPNRIDRITEQLRAVWHTSPDMRLGQLLVNAIKPSQPCPQIFSVEDTITEAKLAKYSDSEGHRYTDNEITLSLTKAEALVLFAFVMRFRDKEKLKIEHEAEAQILWDVCALLQPYFGAELQDRLWVKLLDDARTKVSGDENE
ncbi:hypothetical protein VT84_38120 [Gemmata sp. SH-PL17]|uniref:hypothetical protein n=1 Tax=Gemmata sp. SH-PL17 TaxID=1630693 RepID=UPI00078C1AAD|nr:hypothetical protein [Gemmata sp. SH-PL17]AMV30272.1 hypothetical protein VT84_38120 [Gemmata sp. SH-PL17]